MEGWTLLDFMHLWRGAESGEDHICHRQRDTQALLTEGQAFPKIMWHRVAILGMVLQKSFQVLWRRHGVYGGTCRMSSQ
jgi:hypothetical protein